MRRVAALSAHLAPAAAAGESQSGGPEGDAAAEPPRCRPALAWGAEGFDHVAIGVADLAVSRHWYMRVLGLEDYMQHEPTFVGPELAFMRSGAAALALLHISSRDDATSSTFHRRRVSRAQKGHFALRTDGATFWRLHADLPELLEAHRVRPEQSTAILCDDFAVQLSMFFEDPDGNEVEIATWDCERDDTCSRFGAVSELSIRGGDEPREGAG
jgi:catechol 2,3-dioxygenase-like lactoylglutathione lyase family enzyme